MANLPQSLSLNAPPFPLGSAATSASSAAAAGAQLKNDGKMQSAETLVHNLGNPDRPEYALLELSKNKEPFQDLAPLLWNSFGTIAALVQEILSIYPVLSPPTLTRAQSNRACNALALLQVDDTEVISFLLSTEIIPLCLRTMEMEGELSKTVATFIVQKILLDDVGLEYICTTAERFFAVGRVLANMVATLAEQPSSRLLKRIIRCYLRLSDNHRACVALRSCLPDMLRDATFANCLCDDPTTRTWLLQLLQNVGPPSRMAMEAGGRYDHMLVN